MGKKLLSFNPDDAVGDITSQDLNVDTSDFFRNRDDQYFFDPELDQGFRQGQDRERTRAYNQSTGEEVLAAVENFVPNTIGLLAEQVGYLGELPELFISDNPDFTNALVEWGKKTREEGIGGFGGEKIYRKNADEVFDFGDSASYVNATAGLFESIAAFAATGAGVGSLLGKGASIAANVAKGAVYGNRARKATQVLEAIRKVGAPIPRALRGASTIDAVGQATAQGATAATLAYAEGMMGASEAYKNTLDYWKKKGGISDEAAKKKAVDAGLTAVKINTALNTALNFTGVGVLFNKPTGAKALRKAIEKNLNKVQKARRKQGLDPLTPAQVRDYERKALGLNARDAEVGKMEATISPERISPLTTAGRESVQEGIEELNNEFATKTGEAVGRGEEESNLLKNIFNLEAYYKRTFTEEGALSFVLGAIGGSGQQLAISSLPAFTGGADKFDSKSVSKYEQYIERLQSDETFKSREETKAKEQGKTLDDIIKERSEDANWNKKELVKTKADGKFRNNVARINAEEEYELNKAKHDLKADIEYMESQMGKINDAIRNNVGDKEIEQLKSEMFFRVPMLRSIKNGNAEELINQLEDVVTIDNTTDLITEVQQQLDKETSKPEEQQDAEKIAKLQTTLQQYNKEAANKNVDVYTEAVRLGLTDSQTNDDYKSQTIELVQQSKDAKKEYDDLLSFYYRGDVDDAMYTDELWFNRQRLKGLNNVLNKFVPTEAQNKELENIQRQVKEQVKTEFNEYLSDPTNKGTVEEYLKNKLGDDYKYVEDSLKPAIDEVNSIIKRRKEFLKGQKKAQLDRGKKIKKLGLDKAKDINEQLKDLDTKIAELKVERDEKNKIGAQDEIAKLEAKKTKLANETIDQANSDKAAIQQRKIKDVEAEIDNIRENGFNAAEDLDTQISETEELIEGLRSDLQTEEMYKSQLESGLSQGIEEALTNSAMQSTLDAALQLQYRGQFTLFNPETFEVVSNENLKLQAEQLARENAYLESKKGREEYYKNLEERKKKETAELKKLEEEARARVIEEETQGANNAQLAEEKNKNNTPAEKKVIKKKEAENIAKGDFDYDALTIPTEYETLDVIQADEIQTNQHTAGTSQLQRSPVPRIVINRKKLVESHGNKAWNTPRIAGVKPLSELTGNEVSFTPEEWRDFVLEHEYQHFLYKQGNNESVAEYKNRINVYALNHLGYDLTDTIFNKYIKDKPTNSRNIKLENNKTTQQKPKTKTLGFNSREFDERVGEQYFVELKKGDSILTPKGRYIVEKIDLNNETVTGRKVGTPNPGVENIAKSTITKYNFKKEEGRTIDAISPDVDNSLESQNISSGVNPENLSNTGKMKFQRPTTTNEITTGTFIAPEGTASRKNYDRVQKFLNTTPDLSKQEAVIVRGNRIDDFIRLNPDYLPDNKFNEGDSTKSKVADAYYVLIKGVGYQFVPKTNKDNQYPGLEKMRAMVESKLGQQLFAKVELSEATLGSEPRNKGFNPISEAIQTKEDKVIVVIDTKKESRNIPLTGTYSHTFSTAENGWTYIAVEGLAYPIRVGTKTLGDLGVAETVYNQIIELATKAKDTIGDNNFTAKNITNGDGTPYIDGKTGILNSVMYVTTAKSPHRLWIDKKTKSLVLGENIKISLEEVATAFKGTFNDADNEIAEWVKNTFHNVNANMIGEEVTMPTASGLETVNYSDHMLSNVLHTSLTYNEDNNEFPTTNRKMYFTIPGEVQTVTTNETLTVPEPITPISDVDNHSGVAKIKMSKGVNTVNYTVNNGTVTVESYTTPSGKSGTANNEGFQQILNNMFSVAKDENISVDDAIKSSNLKLEEAGTVGQIQSISETQVETGLSLQELNKESPAVLREYISTELADIARSDRRRDENKTKLEDLLGKFTTVRIARDENTGVTVEQSEYQYGMVQHIKSDDGSIISRVVDYNGKTYGRPVMNLTVNSKEANKFFDGKNMFTLTEKEISEFFKGKFPSKAQPVSRPLTEEEIKTRQNKQQQSLDDALEIQSYGETYREALDGLMVKEKELNNQINKRQRKLNRPVKQYTDAELTAQPEQIELLKINRLINSINNVYSKSSSFDDSTQEAVDFEKAELEKIPFKRKRVPPKTFNVVEVVEPINIYAGTNENADLSNFAKRPFEVFGKVYDTVEGAFQAAKLKYTSGFYGEVVDGKITLNQEGSNLLNKLVNATGAQAKKLGRQIKGLNTKEWDNNSERMMKFLITESFKQNPDALKRLLDTGTATLTHRQDKSKWGLLFPRLLMEVREELGTITPQQPSTPKPKSSLNYDNTDSVILEDGRSVTTETDMGANRPYTLFVSNNSNFITEENIGEFIEETNAGDYSHTVRRFENGIVVSFMYKREADAFVANNYTMPQEFINATKEVNIRRLIDKLRDTRGLLLRQDSLTKDQRDLYSKAFKNASSNDKNDIIAELEKMLAPKLTVKPAPKDFSAMTFEELSLERDNASPEERKIIDSRLIAMRKANKENNKKKGKKKKKGDIASSKPVEASKENLRATYGDLYKIPEVDKFDRAIMRKAVADGTAIIKCPN